MEILKFYLQYQIFPSDYVRDYIVTLLPSQDNIGTIVLESDIPTLDLDLNSDTEKLSS